MERDGGGSCSIDKAVTALFEGIEGPTLLDKDIHLMVLLCGEAATKAAVRMVDDHLVTRVTAAPSGRVVWKVAGNAEYICLNHFCTCRAFEYEVIIRQDKPLCKHLLAVEIAKKTCVYCESTVSDEELGEMICSM
eukprot:TRINITY_DN34546_c0_g1_i1.p1 TRINITY_DN34546_c0_g1~~TRINITY_DN34546_c0_g1_i1.p1  ORF type:complete len:135 (+),score=34.59 TRINITY_DN34546_c0_g1_i1:97-501(+)